MSDSSSDSDQDESKDQENGNVDDQDDDVTFASLGLEEVLCDAAARMGWKKPSKIQKEAIPVAIAGNDVIGLAETGSGKTGAFALPMLQDLIKNPTRLFGLVLTPTRELAYQIAEQFDKLGSELALKTVTLVGGMDMVDQALALGKRPHIIVATPGRLMDHLQNTKGFTLKKSLKYLVLDEADRILNMDFEKEVNQILSNLPREGRRNMLFSATMTKKVAKLQRASLNEPVKVEVSSKYQTVEKLHQYYMFIPHKYKEVYLVHVLNEMQGNSFIIFCSTCSGTMRIAEMLRMLGMSAIPLNGQMSQNKRLGALNKFKEKSRNILVATDVASRGLDIPHVDVVFNYDIPTHSKDYIHRVGRTARAGRSGKAITAVSQYDVELYQRIEQLIQKKLPLYDTVEDEVMQLRERVEEFSRAAKIKLKTMEEEQKDRKRKRGRPGDNFDDSEFFDGVRKRVKGGGDDRGGGRGGRDRGGGRGGSRGGGGRGRGGGGRGGSRGRR